MDERKHISLIYQYDDNWIGGTYYILNIIKVLQLLDDNIKPFLTIIYDDEKSLNDIKILKYPYIRYQYINLKFSFFEKVINKIYWMLFGNVFFKKKLPGDSIENLYPASLYINTSNINNFYYWIPDFQERHLPDFFSKKEIKDRIKIQTTIKNSGKPIIFSSNHALNDYNTFYPNNLNKKVVLRFASMVDASFSIIPIELLKGKYKINKPYFLVPNQFWQHKNQTIVVKAAKLLKEQNIDFQIVFTGKEYDNRNPNYIKDLKQYCSKNQLEKNVLFLGFIDRNDQLQLMKHSVAIIQPSLFEGWSTVVEDAKAIEQYIIVSAIPLHKEQILYNCDFFDPYNANDLALKIINLLNKEIVMSNIDYNGFKINFARSFLEIF